MNNKGKSFKKLFPFSLKELFRYLDTAFFFENEITDIYLALDPAVIWNHSKKRAANWETLLSDYLFPMWKLTRLFHLRYYYWLDMPSAKVDHTLVL